MYGVKPRNVNVQRKKIEFDGRKFAKKNEIWVLPTENTV